MMHIASDDQGLESLPLKLMVVAIVASLSIIPAADALDNLRARDFARRADLQLAQVVSCAELLTVAGPGNVRTISLDFSGHGKERFSRLLIGDALDGPNRSSVILELREGDLMVRSANQPPAMLCSPQLKCLEIDSLATEIRMTSVRSGEGTHVIVEER